MKNKVICICICIIGDLGCVTICRMGIIRDKKHMEHSGKSAYLGLLHVTWPCHGCIVFIIRSARSSPTNINVTNITSMSISHHMFNLPTVKFNLMPKKWDFVVVWVWGLILGPQHQMVIPPWTPCWFARWFTFMEASCSHQKSSGQAHHSLVPMSAHQHLLFTTFLSHHCLHRN